MYNKITSAKLECEIYHILDDSVTITGHPIITDDAYLAEYHAFYKHIETFPGSEYVVLFKFDNTQLECELILNESFESDNKFNLTVWNVPNHTTITTNDIIKLIFYWNNIPNKKYFTECIINEVSNTHDSSGIKTVLSGTFVLNSILNTTGISSEFPIITINELAEIVSNKFNLSCRINVFKYIYNFIKLSTFNKSISMLLTEFCTQYNEKYKINTCKWYTVGNTIMIEDGSSTNLKFSTSVIRYIDILKLKLVEETISRKSVQIDISGLPTLHKESFMTIDYSDTPDYLDVPTVNEIYVVTEVKHSISTTRGFYSTVYCYHNKIVAEE